MVLLIVPPNSTLNSAETSLKNTIFLQGFGTILCIFRGTMFPLLEEFSLAKGTPSRHCHRRHCTAATSAAVLPPPPPPPPPPLVPLPPLVLPESLLPCPCPLCRRCLRLHCHRPCIIVTVSIAIAAATFSWLLIVCVEVSPPSARPRTLRTSSSTCPKVHTSMPPKVRWKDSVPHNHQSIRRRDSAPRDLFWIPIVTE